METDELARLMHESAPDRGEPLDLDRIHGLGRRRRRTKRVVTGTAALAVVAVMGGVWALLGPHGGGGVVVRAASEDHQVTGLTAYEKKALADVEGSYEVDGTVVLPDVADPDAETYQSVSPVDIEGTPQALGFHGTVGPMYLPSQRTEEAYQDNAPKGSQVVIDPGPLWIGCPVMVKGEGCSPSVLAKDVRGRFLFLYGFGSDHFLEPGAEMELFTDDDYSQHRWSQALIGGFHGATTTRVLVETTDGTQAEAQLDVDRMSPGNTLFWARLAKPVAWVRAYDANGKLLAEHKLRDCKNPVDCEVR